MELATKLQLLEEAMVGADTIMERRTEMMRALAEENEDLLAMVETAESQGQGGNAMQHQRDSVSFAPTMDSMSQIRHTPISEHMRYSPTQPPPAANQATPGEAWPEHQLEELGGGYEEGYFDPGAACKEVPMPP